jgi:chromosome segregation ATPase
MTENKGGRPISYTPGQLEDALVRAEAESNAPSLAEIKRHLQAVTGQKRAPNDASLQRNLEDVRSARQRRKEDALVDALPDMARDKIGNAQEQLQRSAMLAVAEAIEAEKARLSNRDVAREREKEALAFELRAVENERDSLKTDLEESRAALANAQAERDDAHRRLSEAKAMEAALELLIQKVAELGGDPAVQSPKRAPTDQARHRTE